VVGALGRMGTRTVTDEPPVRLVSPTSLALPS
jgi:hypothetical protein